MRRMLTLLPMAMAMGCLDVPPYRCERDAQCFSQGYPGTCDRASSTCVYPSADCRGILSIEGYVDGQGNCVPAPNNIVGPSTTSTGADEGESTGGTAASTESSDTTTTDSTTSTPGESSIGATSSAMSSSSSGGESSTGGRGCEQPIQDLTNYGTVSASSQANGYPATRANDGDHTTSWFTSEKMPAFTWTSAADRCIERIEVDDNSMHANAMLRVNYGFQQSVVQVLQDGIVVFEETVPLPGSPDGNYVVETGGAIGSSVVLQLGPNDGAFLGGFSELRVFGDP